MIFDLFRCFICIEGTDYQLENSNATWAYISIESRNAVEHLYCAHILDPTFKYGNSASSIASSVIIFLKTPRQAFSLSLRSLFISTYSIHLSFNNKIRAPSFHRNKNCLRIFILKACFPNMSENTRLFGKLANEIV